MRSPEKLSVGKTTVVVEVHAFHGSNFMIPWIKKTTVKWKLLYLIFSPPFKVRLPCKILRKNTTTEHHLKVNVDYNELKYSWNHDMITQPETTENNVELTTQPETLENDVDTFEEMI